MKLRREEIASSTRYLVFENNTAATRELMNFQQRQGLYEGEDG